MEGPGGDYRRCMAQPPEMEVADSILDLVGNTPLVRLRRLIEAEGLQCTLLAKVEIVNPGRQRQGPASRSR